MHTAIINRIAVDRAGRWVVTASDDRTARIWNLASGQLVRVLRVPLGEGNEGKLYAVALSPDGALVALGGFTQPDGHDQAIYLFNRGATGRWLTQPNRACAKSWMPSLTTSAIRHSHRNSTGRDG
jgi:WD40 repeat protein